MQRRDFIKTIPMLWAGLMNRGLTPAQANEREVNKPDQRIIVVGAGMAGLATARHLHDQGYRVQVLEARTRLGGRIWTSRQWHDAPVDMGASWIHGIEGNPITALAQQIKTPLVATRYDSNMTYGVDGQPANQRTLRRLRRWQQQVHQMLKDGQNAEVDRSIQATLDRAFKPSTLASEDRQLIDFIVNGSIEHEYAGASHELSTHWYDSAQAFAGDDALFPQGYQSIVEHLGQGLDVRLTQVVRRIDWSGNRLKIHTTDVEYECDKLVLTLPLGVLKAGDVTFNPVLPADKLGATSALGMGVLNKCYLRFAKSFWPGDVDWLEQIPPERGQWTQWVSFSRALNQPVILGFNAADYGQAIEKQSDQAIVAGAMKVLRRIFGQSIPEPMDYQITRWRNDPYARGSYSFNAIGSKPLMRDQLAQPMARKIYFAGEATHRDHFATVHGAYLSGLRAAEQVIDDA